MSLREALLRNEGLSDDGILYAPSGVELTLETPCALVTFEDWADDDPPASCDIDGVKYIELLPVDPFQQVIWNAREQRPNLSDDMLIDAVRYYCEFDAFIDFDDVGAIDSIRST